MLRYPAEHAALHCLIALCVIISRVLLLAAATVTAIVAAQQGASSMSLDDQAGPSRSAGRQAPGPLHAAQIFLTLFGKKESCEAAQQAIEQKLQVGSQHPS